MQNRRLPRLLAAALGLAPLLSAAISFAQAPPAVPALPDQERRTSYSLSATNCACAVNLALYGSGSDVDSWIEVWVAGTRYLSTDPSFGWSLSSITGPLGTIPRPITNAVLTFNAVHTGTVQIVGAERPRRLTQFQNNQPVAARDLNQAITDLVAVERELWDKTNDVTGRSILGRPGETMTQLPAAGTRANSFLFFDSGGNPGVASGTVPAAPVTNPNLAPMPSNTIKCNNTGGSLAPADCTAAQTNAITNAVDNLFKSGRPWADVRAWGAVCDSSTDDTTAIQNAENAIAALGGGTVFVPPGGCKVTSTISVTAAVCFVGSNAQVSNITGQTSDITVLSFAANVKYACIEKLFIIGYTNAAATNPAVLVGTNAIVNMRDCIIWGGPFSLQTAGVDGRITNCYFSGWGPAGGGINSTGANFWTDNKIDQPVVMTAYGFFQGIPPALAENHFINNDFSGLYTTASFASNDGGAHRNINIITGGVFSSPIILTNSSHTSLIGAEIGSTTISNGVGTLAVTGSFAFAATTATGAGVRSCSANINLTC